MNYMVQKVKRSELKRIFGNEWIRDHNWKWRKYAMDYEGASWGSALLLLRYEFYIENHYQEKAPELLPYFRGMLLRHTDIQTFVGRFYHCISDKYIKFNADDLENYLMDLFERPPK
ncbi:hypothetical protein L484_023119 [Morus notabilis]|uniref:Exocyst subunit Exo70 family protein n=1 Tax=Morus notabilis TaxID=981085 RepID=W9RLS0_9ROSA|nr:hypothetical protein L484_023119 [Morus notabilis]